MKKLLAFLLLFLMAFPFFGCTEKKTEPEEGTKKDGTAEFDTWTAHFINVGKADSILIEADGLFYLIDTGLSSSTVQLEKTFSKYEVKTLEGVFITHTDKDHIGGLKWLLKSSGIDVKNIYAPQIGHFDNEGKDDVNKKAEKYNHTVTRLKKGDSVPIGKNSLKFEILGPVTLAEGENNISLVMKLTGNCNRALFMGDAEIKEELTLINQDLDADLLKVGHHGQDDASSYDFIKKVSPEISIISTNIEERPDSAAPSVINNLKAVDSEVYITQAFELEIVITSNAEGKLVKLN